MKRFRSSGSVARKAERYIRNGCEEKLMPWHRVGRKEVMRIAEETKYLQQPDWQISAVKVQFSIHFAKFREVMLKKF